MTEASQPIPTRVLENTVSAVAVFPDRRRMVMGSADKTLRMWDLKDGVMLKKMEGHRAWVRALAVSGGGQSITSGDISSSRKTTKLWSTETSQLQGDPIDCGDKVHCMSGELLAIATKLDIQVW